MVERLVPLLVLASAFAYAVGIRRLWSATRRARLVSGAQAAAFGAAVAALLVALESPLDTAADRSLSLHMVQHLILLAVIPPLLAASQPVTVMMHALSPRARARVAPAVRRVVRSQSSTTGWLLWTVFAFALSTCTLALWHLPALYDAAVDDDVVHALEHATFLLSATLFWWMVLGGNRRSRRGLGVMVVFAATLPATALGILMTLARTPWYAPYGRGAAALQDQQVAGALMWGFGGVALVVGAAALFASWLVAMERTEAVGPTAVEPW